MGLRLAREEAHQCGCNPHRHELPADELWSWDCLRWYRGFAPQRGVCWDISNCLRSSPLWAFLLGAWGEYSALILEDSSPVESAVPNALTHFSCHRAPLDQDGETFSAKSQVIFCTAQASCPWSQSHLCLAVVQKQPQMMPLPVQLQLQNRTGWGGAGVVAHGRLLA